MCRSDYISPLQVFRLFLKEKKMIFIEWLYYELYIHRDLRRTEYSLSLVISQSYKAAVFYHSLSISIEF